MNRYLLLILVFLLLPSVLPAQPDPNANPGQPPPVPRVDPGLMGGKMNPGQRVMAAEVTPNGVFLLSDGLLARYSPDLEQCATLQLLPPMPPPPNNGGNDKQAMQKWFNERNLRNTPSAMLPAGDMLYIVCSGMLFRVNQNTLKVEKTLLDPQPQPDMKQPLNVSTPPLLKLQEDTLYIIRQLDLVAVDLKTGAVLKRTDLPKEMIPIIPVPLGPAPDGMVPQPGGKQLGEGEAARATTVVGVLGSRKDGEHTVYTVQTEAGALYLLSGDQLNRIAGDINGKRVRVTGMLEPRQNLPPAVMGMLRVQAIQLLEE